MSYGGMTIMPMDFGAAIEIPRGANTTLLLDCNNQKFNSSRTGLTMQSARQEITVADLTNQANNARYFNPLGVLALAKR